MNKQVWKWCAGMRAVRATAQRATRGPGRTPRDGSALRSRFASPSRWTVQATSSRRSRSSTSIRFVPLLLLLPPQFLESPIQLIYTGLNDGNIVEGSWIVVDVANRCRVSERQRVERRQHALRPAPPRRRRTGAGAGRRRPAQRRRRQDLPPRQRHGGHDGCLPQILRPIRKQLPLIYQHDYTRTPDANDRYPVANGQWPVAGGRWLIQWMITSWSEGNLKFSNDCGQGEASVLLSSLEKERELLRIFLRASQLENPALRRMDLHAFLMVTRTRLSLVRTHPSTPTTSSSF